MSLKKIKLFLAILLVISLTTSGCGNKINKKPEKVQRKEKAPESLKAIYDNVDKIVEAAEIETKEKEERKEEQEEEKLESEEDGAKEEENNKAKDEEDKDKEKENKNKESKNKEESQKELDQIIREIYESWNKYEIEAIKKGATNNNVNKFRESLDNLAIVSEKKETYNMISNGSQVFLALAPFFNLYKDDIYGETSLIKYYVYQGYLSGLNGEVDKGEEFLSLGEEQINRLNTKIEEDKKKNEDVGLLKKSIEDMKFSLKSNSSQLLKIKKDIIIGNLKKLEE